MKNKKICFVSTTYKPIKLFMLDNLISINKNFEIYIFCKNANELKNDVLNLNIHLYNVNFSRKINILNDIICLIKLFFLIKKHKFDIVHSMNPKTGLLSMISASLLNVKTRIHTFTGQVWFNKKKTILKSILILSDKIISKLSTHLLCDSFSQKNFLLKKKITDKSKIRVLGNGSINGVDIKKFALSKKNINTLRKNIGISITDFVILYVGRFNQEKGILNLLKSFNNFIEGKSNALLLFVGDDEMKLKSLIHDKYYHLIDKIKIFNFTDNINEFYLLSDLFVSLSYREGFGNVLIEAGSSSLPSLVSNIYGFNEIISNNKNGFLVNNEDTVNIIKYMELFYNNIELRERFGKNAFDNVKQKYSREFVINKFKEFYYEIL